MFDRLSAYIVHNLLGLSPESKLATALNFFMYDTAKIFILLAVIIFAISFIRSFFPPEKTRAILSHKKEFIGNILAALLGVVTPFCSCSAVPLFIGFVEGGVPLGVTFSFLISSPMVNEVAAEKCPIFTGHATILRWSFENPASFTGNYEEILAKTREIRDRIKKKVEEFIAEHSGEGGNR